MSEEKLIKTVQSTFSLYGLVLSRKLSVSLAKQLLSVNEDERESWLMQITEKILAQNLQNPHVEVHHIKLAIEECVKPDTLQNTETILNVINAFDIPKIKHDLSRKKFILENVSVDLYPDAQYKSAVFKDRFELLWYRTIRHELFTPPKFGEKKEDKIRLTPIEYLLSESKTEEDALLMEGSIVIANGIYKEGILQVEDIGFPPAESSNNSRVDFGDANTFGGPHNLSLKLSDKLKIHEEANKDGMLIFISELWLDNATVLQKFKTMLEGYSEFPPIAFVLCGHFLSFPSNVTSAQKLKEGFKNLAELINQYPDIRETSKFIFVPAPYDLGAPKILPRGPLPQCLTKEFSKTVPGAIFATNPCRIQYCTKEIVVLREDILTKMCRNTIYFPSEGNVFDHYAKSIICQSHLAPLNLSVAPVYWKYDHTLQIYPTPDLIVVADQFEAYATVYSNCHIINPGMFPKNDFSFKVYVPSLDLIEHCGIPKEIDVV
ncbi:hypothetical protein KM043_002169 [Ampulex compressa]|nr:hypothetical protein KM043_002169 [Ampulex compressa]